MLPALKADRVLWASASFGFNVVANKIGAEMSGRGGMDCCLCGCCCWRWWGWWWWWIDLLDILSLSRCITCRSKSCCCCWWWWYCCCCCCCCCCSRAIFLSRGGLTGSRLSRVMPGSAEMAHSEARCCRPPMLMLPTSSLHTSAGTDPPNLQLTRGRLPNSWIWCWRMFSSDFKSELFPCKSIQEEELIRIWCSDVWVDDLLLFFSFVRICKFLSLFLLWLEATAADVKMIVFSPSFSIKQGSMSTFEETDSTLISTSCWLDEILFEQFCSNSFFRSSFSTNSATS